jgi:teichuronic acid exporter
MTLASRARSAIIAFALQAVTQRLIVLLGQIALARFLLPAEFGQIGLAYAITAIPSSLANFGIDDVLIQRRKALRFWAGPASRLSLVLGISLGLFVCGIAPLAASLYDSGQLAWLIIILGAAIPINAFATVPTARMRAALHFRMQATVNLLEVFAATVCALVLAAYGFGPYSIVLPVPFIAILRTAYLWHRFPPDHAPRAFSYSKYLIQRSGTVLLHRLTTIAMAQYPILIVGLTAGSEEAGIYYFAYRLAVQPIAAIAGMFQGLFFPLLMQLKHDPTTQERTTFRVIRILNFVAMTIGWLMAAISEPLIQALFGQKWSAAAPLVAILSVGVAFDAGAWIAGALLSARGEFRRAFLYTLSTAPIYVAAIALGVLYAPAQGAALGFALSYVIVGPVFVLLAMPASATREHAIRTSYGVPIVGSLLPFLACATLRLSPLGHAHAVVQIAVLSTVYAVTAAAIFIIVRENPMKDVLTMARSRRPAV